MNLAIGAVVLVTLLILLGCKNLQEAETGGEYWIAGLTLPSGSTVVKKSDDVLSKADESSIRELAVQRNSTEMARPVDRVLSVSFDCQAGWNALSTHIDSCLKGQGFSEVKQNPKLQSAADNSRITQVMGSQHIYTKSGADFWVSLDKMSVLGAKPPPGVGEYLLTIYRLK